MTSQASPWKSGFSLFLRTLLTGWVVSRLSLLLHEIIGHGGLIWAMGGKIDTPELSWFGVGSIGYDRVPPFSSVELALIALGAPVAQAIAGSLALLAMKWARRPGWRFFWMSFAAINLVFVPFSLVTTIDHRHGDFWEVAVFFPELRLSLITAGLVATAVTCLFFGVIFVRESLGFVRSRTFVGRTLEIGFPVLFAAGLTLGLAQLEHRSSVEMGNHAHHVHTGTPPIIGAFIWILIGASLSLGALATLWREQRRASSGRTPAR